MSILIGTLAGACFGSAFLTIMCGLNIIWHADLQLDLMKAQEVEVMLYDVD